MHVVPTGGQMHPGTLDVTTWHNRERSVLIEWHRGRDACRWEPCAPNGVVVRSGTYLWSDCRDGNNSERRNAKLINPALRGAILSLSLLSNADKSAFDPCARASCGARILPAFNRRRRRIAWRKPNESPDSGSREVRIYTRNLYTHVCLLTLIRAIRFLISYVIPSGRFKLNKSTV